MSSAPRPGWYRDPAGTPGAYRWWDGDTWTQELSDSAQAPTPAPLLAVDESDPSTESAELEGAPRRHSAARRVVSVLVVVALFAGSGIGIGLWLWQDPSPAAQTAPGASTRAVPEAPTPQLGGQLDERTRTATIQSASMVLPDVPYEVRDDPVALESVFDAAFAAEAVVHRDYDGRQDWSAMVALASIDRSLTDSGDLTAAGITAVGRMARLLYGNRPTVSDVATSDRAVDGRSGILITAKVSYRLAQLPSRYDVVTALVVRLDDGTVVAALTSVPDDTDPAITDQAAASLDSLTIG